MAQRDIASISNAAAKANAGLSLVRDQLTTSPMGSKDLAPINSGYKKQSLPDLSIHKAFFITCAPSKAFCVRY